jgi:hypothetical protein
MGGIAISTPIVRGGLGQLCGVCVSYTWKPFEPFEHFSDSATVQLQT